MQGSARSNAVRSPLEPVCQFDQEVPRAFQLEVARCVMDAWRVADSMVRESFEEPERHDLFPHARRATLEKSLRGLALRLGLAATSDLNSRKSSYFTWIRAGRVILTASAVQDPSEIVRYAEFRKTFARSNQLFLFDSPDPPSPDCALYALVLHGPGAVEMDEKGRTRISTSTPGFVDVVFPAPVAGKANGFEYVGGRIKLLDRFQNDLAGCGTIQAEEVTFTAEPTLREVAKVKKSQA